MITQEKVVLKQSIGNYRWRICALLFFATTINYVDRSVLSYVANNPEFKCQMLGIPVDSDLSGHEEEFNVLYGNIQAWFKLAYGIGFILMGWLMDRFGTRLGYTIAVGVWSLSAIAHSLVSGVRGMIGARVGLGLGESGNFPAAIKTVAEWFPKKERSLATGIFNAGANLGVIGTAFLVPILLETYGWQTTFLITSTLGVVLFFTWLRVYRKPDEHPSLTEAERAYIQSEQTNEPKGKVSWLSLFPHRQTWAFAVGKFMTDCIWWFYLTWLPKFFSEHATFNLDLKTIGIPFVIIYLVSDGGSVVFGWVSSYLLKLGWSVNRARKTTMLVCALCVVPIYFASVTQNMYVAIALISLAAAAHQGWSANLFTTVTDMFPRKAIGSVVGLGGLAGALGGFMLDKNAGGLINNFGYNSLFLIASSAYLIALLLIHLLAPKLKSVEIK